MTGQALMGAVCVVLIGASVVGAIGAWRQGDKFVACVAGVAAGAFSYALGMAVAA